MSLRGAKQRHLRRTAFVAVQVSNLLMDTYFPDSYEDSRARFTRDVDLLRVKWPESQLGKHPLAADPHLSIDWAWLHGRKKEKLFVISTAEHGIEGYVGAAMLKLFMGEFAPRLNPENTGLLLIHAINPWGMQNRYRVNRNNVDLNRNFVHNGNYSPEINRDYDLIMNFLNPQRPVRRLSAEAVPFLFNVIRNMIHPGRARVQAASLLGQHRHEKGIYFGGVQAQEETSVLMALYRKALAEYQSFIQIDMHTGYGPRYQMTVLVSPLDDIPSAEAAQRFNYPLVQKIDVNEFYAISGDMAEYVYRLRDTEFPDRKVFAGGFEFGTYGDSLPALISSLQTTILENQLRHHGAVSREAQEQVRAQYQELFFPKESRWREKALADGRQAFEGILRSYQLIWNEQPAVR
jgi:predicted deacylase